VLIGGPVSGGAVNPARALGPMIVSGTFTDWWAYLLGPVVGAVIAAVVYDRFLTHASTPDPSPSPDTRAGATAAHDTDKHDTDTAGSVDDEASWGGPERVDPDHNGPGERTGTSRL